MNRIANSLRVLRCSASMPLPVRAVQVPQWWLSLAMTGVILCVVLWLIRMLGQQQKVLVALQHSEQKKQELIASLQNEHERSRRAASTDHLSGLYNRREFLQLAAAAAEEQSAVSGEINQNMVAVRDMVDELVESGVTVGRSTDALSASNGRLIGMVNRFKL